MDTNSHRLSTVMNADRIIVISDGQIVESGNHDELIQQEGKYANLWSKQIFTKPKDKSNSGDDAAKIPDFVNDLTPESTEEVAKASNALTAAPEGSSADSVKNGKTLMEDGSTTKDDREVDNANEDDSGSETATEASPPSGEETEVL